MGRSAGGSVAAPLLADRQCLIKELLLGRVPSADRTNIRRLVRETAPLCFEHCLEDRAVRTWTPTVQQDILSATMELAMLTAEMFKVLSSLSPSE